MGVNNRTLAKLNPRRPDHTLELETLDYIYHRLLTLCHVYYIGEEARKEYNLLVESRIRVLMSVRPLPQKVLDRLAERTKDVSL